MKLSDPTDGGIDAPLIRQVEWMVENLARGVSATRIRSAILEMGMSSDAGESILQGLLESPAVAVACELQYRASKAHSLLSSTLAGIQDGSGLSKDGIDHLDDATEAQFIPYHRVQRPVVLASALRGSRIMDEWSLAKLADRFRGTTVEVSANRETDPRFEDNFQSHRENIRWEDFLGIISAPVNTNNTYLVARSDLLAREPFRELASDIPVLPGLTASRWSNEFRPRLWIGPAGTFTPLHHDDRNAFLAQVLGAKRIYLIDPRYFAQAYNDRYCFSSIDVRAVDYEAFPDMRNVPILTATISAGDAIFIPLGWWHAVESLSPSISLTLTNFQGAQIWEQAYLEEVRPHPELFPEPSLLPYPSSRSPYPPPLR